MKATEILVTGAATHLGGNLVRELARQGRGVRAMISPQDSPAALEGLAGVRVVRGDITARAEARLAVRGIRYVLHCAAETRLWARMESAGRRTTVQGTEQICDAARQANVERLVHVSALSDGGEVSLRCADAARDAELRVQQQVDAGLDALIVQPTLMFGPWDVRATSSRLILAVAQRRVMGYPRGGNNFVDVRDVARAMIVALEEGEAGDRYVLGGENRAWRELFALIAEVVGAPAPRLAVPRSLAAAAGAMGELWGGLTGRPPLLSAAEVEVAYLERFCTTQEAETTLHLEHTPLRRAIEDTWSWMQAQESAASAR